MSFAYKIKECCPVCGFGGSPVFLRREQVPVHQHLLFKSKKDAIKTVRGDIEMVVCSNCSFVYNRAFNPELLDYSGEYNNKVISEQYDEHIDGLVSHLIQDCGIKNKFIVEAGCGDGSFIKKLIEKEPKNDGVGYDPSYTGPEEVFDGRLTFVRDFYPEDSFTGFIPDVIICRHLIEHIEYPVEFLRGIKKTLLRLEGVRLFFETPCIEWTLDNRMIFDFFYEHCSLFSAQSFSVALEKAGFYLRSSKHVFGGQYLWVEAGVRLKQGTQGSFVCLRDDKGIEAIKKKVEKYSACGEVAVLGAAAKGVSFVNVVDPLSIYISCVIDDNTDKQGGHIPGTGHPIVPFSAVLDYNINTMLVTNPNYVDSIKLKAKKINPNIKVVNILEEL